ncbi:phage tail protein [Rubritalea spongiae]|uniref:Phage tail protein n=1 Tax=Rubritalea spongiae TaxID=430797 RepID=A0ABW5E662_9BACT
MDPFLAEIKMFAGNFAPRGWAFCDGQLLPISQYSAVFSLVGTIYGGDGRTTFALPDLRSRVPVHPGSGPGLSTYRLGQKGGAETVTLNQTQIPSHSHLIHDLPGTSAVTLSAQAEFNVSTAAADEAEPTDSSYLAAASLASGGVVNMFTETAPDEKLASNAVVVTAVGNGVTSSDGATSNAGGGLPHTNIQPFLCVNFIFALQGVFPSRS